jgi:RNA polymerase sigma factor (sigma-70 family)
MSERAEADLIENIAKNKCEESLRKLANRHSGLYFDICKKYFRRLGEAGIAAEEIIQDRDLIVYKSASSYDPQKKSKYSTWLANCARYHCLNIINQNIKHVVTREEKQIKRILEQRSIENFYNSSGKNLPEYVFNILDQLKDKRISKIFNLRYFSKEQKKSTWNKISKKLGISIQTAINLHSRGRRILSFKMKNEKVEDFV